jgi:hypothetical protein
MAENEHPICSCCGREISVIPNSENSFRGIEELDLKLKIGNIYQGSICKTCHRIICSYCTLDEMHAMKTADEMSRVLKNCIKCGGELTALTSSSLRTLLNSPAA